MASAASRTFWSRNCTICLALAVSVTTWKSSPASGSDSRPSTSTGVEGSALRICAPRSFMHGAHLAEHRAADEEVAHVQRAVAHQHGGHRPAAAVELALRARCPWPGALGLALRSCISATSRIISSSRSRLIWCVLAETGTITVSPPQSSASRPRSASCCLMRSGWASGLSILLMATTMGTLGGAGVVDGFQRLRHDAVVGRHHQHHDVGDLGAAGAHAGEGFVAGRIDEHDLAAVHLHLVRADVLGDAAGFARRHVGFADGVEQRRLAMIHVTHDGDHGRALCRSLVSSASSTACMASSS